MHGFRLSNLIINRATELSKCMDPASDGFSGRCTGTAIPLPAHSHIEIEVPVDINKPCNNPKRNRRKGTRCPRPWDAAGAQAHLFDQGFDSCKATPSLKCIATANREPIRRTDTRKDNFN